MEFKTPQINLYKICKFQINSMKKFENDDREEITALCFTHTITHEFHHKGQIVKIGRQLGYIPLETDLIDS